MTRLFYLVLTDYCPTWLAAQGSTGSLPSCSGICMIDRMERRVQGEVNTLVASLSNPQLSFERDCTQQHALISGLTRGVKHVQAHPTSYDGSVEGRTALREGVSWHGNAAPTSFSYLLSLMTVLFCWPR